MWIQRYERNKQKNITLCDLQLNSQLCSLQNWKEKRIHMLWFFMGRCCYATNREWFLLSFLYNAIDLACSKLCHNFHNFCCLHVSRFLIVQTIDVPWLEHGHTGCMIINNQPIVDDQLISRFFFLIIQKSPLLHEKVKTDNTKLGCSFLY